MENTDLDRGLAALRAGKYETAIALLETIAPPTRAERDVLRARAGLVEAYVKTGDRAAALQLCREMADSDRPQARAWAKKVLARLEPSDRPTPVTDSNSVAEAHLPLPSENDAEIARETDIAPTPADREPAESTPESDGVPDLEPTAAIAPEPDIETDAATAPASSSGEPVASDADVPADEPLSSPLSDPHEIPWKGAGRAEKKWKRLRPLGTAKLYAAQAIAVVLLFFLLRGVLWVPLLAVNQVLIWFARLPFIRPVLAFYRDPYLWIFGFLAIAFLALPWLTDLLLRLQCGYRHLSRKELGRYSRETVLFLREYAKGKGRFVPELRVVSENAPVIFTYGNLRRNARIVVSEGLLALLDDGEIAAVFAAELAHLESRDFAIASWATVVAQLPFLSYWHVAAWGDGAREKRDRATTSVELWVYRICYGMAAIVSTAAYGIYWFVRPAGLWLSRVRLYRSDRTAASFTGNPNALARALLKIAIATARHIQERGETSWLLESLAPLLPVSPQQSLAIGSCYPRPDWRDLFSWERQNTHGTWMAVNNSHPLLGERLQILGYYARFWKLDLEIDLLPEPGERQKPVKHWQSLLAKKSLQEKWQRIAPLIYQGAPYWGALAGFALSTVPIVVGWIGTLFTEPLLAWIWYDRWFLWRGSIFAGFGLGAFLRMNRFFPDIKPSRQQDFDLPATLETATLLPADSPMVLVKGKLLGRSGLRNLLAQDLLLHVPSGIVRLHCTSRFGPVGLAFERCKPYELIGREVTASGWLRRGATLWIDADALRGDGKVCRSGHPFWSLAIAVIASLWGVYAIAFGR